MTHNFYWRQLVDRAEAYRYQLGQLARNELIRWEEYVLEKLWKGWRQMGLEPLVLADRQLASVTTTRTLASA